MPKKNGFTLVELLVVISIIAILSVIGITIFTSAQKASRDSKRRADIKALVNAIELYKNAQGKYPMAGAGAISCEPNWDCSDGRSTCLQSELAPYMQEIPKDPQNICDWNPPGRFYKYHSPNSDGSTYQVAASLENSNSATGDFTVACNPGCIFFKANGGFGFNNQQ